MAPWTGASGSTGTLSSSKVSSSERLSGPTDLAQMGTGALRPMWSVVKSVCHAVALLRPGGAWWAAAAATTGETIGGGSAGGGCGAVRGNCIGSFTLAGAGGGCGGDVCSWCSCCHGTGCPEFVCVDEHLADLGPCVGGILCWVEGGHCGLKKFRFVPCDDS